MKNLAFAALTGLVLATSAEAQTANQTPIPVPYSRGATVPMHAEDSYVDGNWTVPTPEQMKAAWPAKAQKDDVEGRVTIDCAVAPNGGLSSCDILAENPRGYGFGAAAVKIYFKFAHVDPASVTGGLKPYSRRKFDVIFSD